MQDSVELPQKLNQSVLKLRLLIGLLQGLALFFLLSSNDDGAWMTFSPMLYAVLVIVTTLLPPVLIVGTGHLPTRRLLAWTALIALLLAIMAAYSEWRWAEAIDYAKHSFTTRHFWPHEFLLAPFVFIVWSLIYASETDRRWPAQYLTYFECSWKLAVQVKFAAAFVGVFWMVLWLGAGLFHLLDLDFLEQLIKQDWFWAPATTLAIATGLHLTDVRPGIVSGIRNLLLTMLSWLLPLLTLLVAGFLVAIFGVGFEPLWRTRFATALLLGTCAAVVVLVNVAYQAGNRRAETHALIRYAATLASCLLTPLVLIAGYALSLRVRQYGWTPDRIVAAACVLTASLYALGYLWAAVDPKLRRQNIWLGHIALTNIYAATLIVVLAFCLLSPIADPARISVSSQMNLLSQGKTKVDAFDFKFLRFEGARFGAAALAEMANSADAMIKSRAEAAQKMQNSWEQGPPAQTTFTERVILKTAGKTLPADFVSKSWSNIPGSWSLPSCMTAKRDTCDAYMADYSGQGHDEVLVLPRTGNDAVLFSNADGVWQPIATFSIPPNCTLIDQALIKGEFKRVAPNVPDLMVAGQRFHADEMWINKSRAACR